MSTVKLDTMMVAPMDDETRRSEDYCIQPPTAQKLVLNK
jgi:hypothetical protein